MTTACITTVIFNVDVKEPLQVLDIQIAPQRHAPKDRPKKNLVEYVTKVEDGVVPSVRLAVQSELPDVQAVVSWQIEKWSEPPDFEAEGERHERVCQALEGAVHLATGIPVRVSRGFMVGGEPMHVYVPPPEWPRGQALKPATLTTEDVPLLEDVVSILRAERSRRFEVALLEYDSALHALDIRREFIHGVIALEALFGDSDSEATSFKVATRASLFLRGFKGKAREGFRLVKTLYRIRSEFVHGDWDEKTLRMAEENAGRLRRVGREALLECVRWVKSGRPWEPDAIDDEVLFKR